MNGNAQRVGGGGGRGRWRRRRRRRGGEDGYRTVPLTIVRWWLCSLAHAHARPSRTHTSNRGSSPPPPSPLSPSPAFPLDSLYFYPGSFARYLLFAAMAMQTRWRGDAARRAPVAPSTGKAIVPLLKMEYRSPSHDPSPPHPTRRTHSIRNRVWDRALDRDLESSTDILIN